MTATPAEPQGPLITRPPQTIHALRRAVAHITPASLPAFNSGLVEAAEEADERGSIGPIRRFVQQWAVHVEIERHPQQAARLHELEALTLNTDDRETARAAAAEAGRIYATACTALGLRTGGATR
ncbi:hypothetical protein [Wenjunlia tyrosinilytica]|uniref:Uncharacterized protein n=1 Tax=Wenjunlia tyrosinilytica TaxID=1544741 RepID=A0A917ZY66_9ACTN|nr:hypothetical protein [Wenjunlia tyrosinilytica]GGO98198.1 hypothetical protein GCM10012280_61770 [Wenjunlia tyrosinilytica]